MLDDAVLDVVEPGVVGVEYRAGRGDVVGVLRPDIPRQVEDGVQPGADPAALRGGIRRPLQLVDLLQRRGAGLLRQVGGLDAGPVGGRFGAAVAARAGTRTGAAQLGQLLANGVELAAQQELTLLAVHALLDVAADGLRDVQFGQMVLGPRQQPFKPRGDVRGAQQLDLLRGGQVGGVAGGVGERGRIGDRRDGVDDLPGAALAQQVGDQGAVLLRQVLDLRRILAGPRGGGVRRSVESAGRRPGPLVHHGVAPHGVDPGDVAGTRAHAADTGPGGSADDRGRAPSRQPADLFDHPDGGHVGERAVGPGNQQHLGGPARRLTGDPRRPRVGSAAGSAGTGGFDGGSDLTIGHVERHDHAR